MSINVNVHADIIKDVHVSQEKGATNSGCITGNVFNKCPHCGEDIYQGTVNIFLGDAKSAMHLGYDIADAAKDIINPIDDPFRDTAEALRELSA